MMHALQLLLLAKNNMSRAEVTLLSCGTAQLLGIGHPHLKHNRRKRV